MADLPEPCLKDQCRSPLACDAWGYCRERNMGDFNRGYTETMRGRRQMWAAERKARRYCSFCEGPCKGGHL